MKLYFRCAAMAVLSMAVAWAQRSDAKGMTVRGEIVSSDVNVGNLSVELVGDGQGLSETVAVNLDGSFEFRSCSPGTRQLRVIAPNGAVIHEEYVSISSSNQTLSIHLPDRSPAGAANRGGATVSLQQLNHKVPAAAQKAYQKGEQAASKGNLEDACADFEEAVKIDP